jgi:hypothetical protein
LKDAKLLALQQFIPENAYSAEYKAIKPYDAETIRRFAETLKPYVKKALYMGLSSKIRRICSRTGSHF